MNDSDSKPKYPVGVSVLLVRAGKLLLGKRAFNKDDPASGFFSTPGGRIENNETLIDCAIRETLEETGLYLRKSHLSIIGFKEHFRFGHHYFMVYVTSSRFTGILKNEEPSKCEGWTWFAPTEIPKDCTEPSDIIASALNFALLNST